MAACVLWITLGLYIFLMPKTAITDESRSIRMPSLRRSGPQPTKVTTIHQAADGTKKITTTITNPDGSKTVTEEVEPAA